ncbi:pyridoxal phosphate-dependent transferase [Kickxella alabastrina]|uniref:pyridoxal phosphate-dependent transferase n=1 Tax=Kickxella alabastrina TaxID=61397 RepID=UPI002220A31E|nr:pyridoxal phosphate-dependent transferase [Kickxella alabastrina]KAI7833615.1 pyridoxal phosphate-dependent transferase [Kickxella alabastrina]
MDSPPTRSPTDNSSSTGSTDELHLLLSEAAKVFSEYARDSLHPHATIVTAATPSDIASQLDLTFPDSGTGHPGIWKDIRNVCITATNTWSDRFLYKLYAAPTPIGVVSETLMALLNNNAHVFQSSPAGAVLEAAVGTKLAEMANFSTKTAAGLTFPGGSYSNMHALMVARNQRFPELKHGGIVALAKADVRPVIFTSAHAHYSIEKSQLLRVSDSTMLSVCPQMIGIAAGGTPFFVNATAGTTELGIWLHVDGSWGSPLALFADPSVFEYPIPAGRINSLTINPHKLLVVMRETLGLNASYLFHSAPEDDESADGFGLHQQKQNLAGAGTLATPRWDVIWISWRYYGTKYFSDRVGRARQLAVEFADMITSRNTTCTSEPGNWKLFVRPQSICVCFWFIPHSEADRHGGRKNNNGSTNPQCWWGDVTKALCNRVNATGKLLLDYACVDRFAPTSVPSEYNKNTVPFFFRIPFNSPGVTVDTLEAILNSIELAARHLYSN